METISVGFIISVFGAGLLSFFSPCILPLLPVYVGYLSTGSAENENVKKASFTKALAFTGGLSLSFFVLGFGAGSLGSFVNSNWLLLICGSIVVLFGFYQTGLLPLSFLERNMKLSVQFDPQKGLGGAFLLGLLFSIGWTPCVGPILGAVLGIASQQGSAPAGGALLLVYSLGLSLPFCILALASQQLLQKVKHIYPHFGKIRLAGGILIMLMGFWMLYTPITSMLAKDVQAPEKAFAEAPLAEAQASLQGSPIYSMNFAGLNSEPISLAKLAGKTVYIKFWATWCPTCLGGLEEFTALAEQMAHKKDIVVLSVVTPGLNGEMSENEFAEWAKAQQLSFPVYFDPSGALNREFGIRAYPTGVFISKDGAVMQKKVGHESNTQIIHTLTSTTANEVLYEKKVNAFLVSGVFSACNNGTVGQVCIFKQQRKK